jgi:hypothetical protein
MANEDHVRRLKEGVGSWNQWRSKNSSVLPDLSGADLDKTDLEQADLRGAELSRANLARAKLLWANLSGANLSEANLREANLRAARLASANLGGADLGETNLRGVDFTFANLSRARLGGADLGLARMALTIITDIDLRNVKGLESVQHFAPSHVGIDTIYRSNGEIPEVFLRRSGVPDTFLAFMRSLTGKAFEFYSCFISYSFKNQDFADRLYADLQAKGVRCWFAPHDVKGGRKLHEQIDEAIRLHDRLLLILSPESMSSEWVKTEIAKARMREVREKARVLFPVRLCSFDALRDWECFDADTGKDLAKEIREYFIPDFSDWKNHDAYQVAFERLLRDLKPADAAAASAPSRPS